MKIGVVTFHNSENYGAFLQCLALQEILQKEGYESFVIDYVPKSERKKYRIIKTESFKEFLTSLLFAPMNFLRKRRFKKCKRIFNLADKEEYFDIAITGSDQVWNNKLTGGIADPYYTLQKVEAKNRIAYAASVGNANDEYIKKILPQKITTINKISVRENKTKTLLNMKDIEVVLDPTLLLTSAEWERFLSKKRTKAKAKTKYVVEYMIEGDTKRKTRKYTSKLGYDTYDFSRKPSRQRRVHYAYSYSPFDFVDAIRNAEIVFTTSFHGIIFSIIFKKDFFITIKRKDNRERIESLLNELGLKDRIVESGQEIPNFRKQKINWDKVYSIIEKKRTTSLMWLINAIGGKNE